MNGGKSTEEEITIPELDDIASKRQKYIFWSADEDALLKKYYHAVPAAQLLKYLPGRTMGGLRRRAQDLGLQQIRRINP